MSSVLKTIPNSTTSPPCHTPKDNSNYSKSHNHFIFFKQPRTPSLLHSKLNIFCRSSVGVSSSLANTTHNVTADQNAKICKFCEMGDLRNAMESLIRSTRHELGLNTYCSVLQLCAERKSLEDGKRIHFIIVSKGIPIKGALGAKLVFMYVNCGDLVKGREIFDEILNDKVFLWNLMMSEYAKIGNYRESLGLFNKMQKLGIAGDSYTFTCVLKCFTALGKVKECKRVHGYVLKLGFGSSTAVVNSLIAAYFKFGGVESAHNLFDELSDRDVVSWNSMINGCVVNGFSRNGLEIFIQMLILGVGVDLTTLVSVLVACANIGNLSLGRALHAFGVKAPFSGEVVFSNTLLDMYSKCGNLNGATEVFVKMGETTIVSWTSIIAAYVREGLYDDAIGLFDEMQSKGVRPDIYTVTSIVHACACSNSLDKGRDVHSYVIKNSMVSNLPVANALMNMYAKCGSMEEARLVFSQIPAKDIVSWNTMIGGYSKNSLPNGALELFSDMVEQLKPDDITMACVLPACAGLAALDKGREIHGHILRRGYFSDLHVACALVDMYAKCGLLVLAQILFDMIPKKDLISWTVMIAGYGMHGFGNEAISTFNKMRIAGIEPDESSFTAILNACSHSGLLNEGWRFFNSMRNECSIEPKLEHYACMVDLLGRAGNLSKAYKFIESMPIKPNATIWGALLSGCRIHHDVKLAEKVADHVFELEPDNTRYYVVLANVYAEAEKWEEAKKLRERMQRRGFKQNPGCSWIEVRGKFNIFVAGNTKHPQAKRIDTLLRKLKMQMKNGDFSTKLKYALINADEMEKEVIQCGHSEKLAMAFGILNLPPGRTVRVAKNRRVCGECHEIGKFMSKTTKREIVLRDSNRFHHFKDGLCSCRGFW
ncbi:pentatricopeptide repeat-containing protein DOT4, chloroplastic [Cicer arietinum]|uniref:Pentatricopeptide repeat-containing protein DOT4, chloroplastic n=1 Tax=Cicer arietinum TaxID=3827 RepID=A0A1S2YG30_CICAR|nr:pentatricopeptide repeat-containing protein DOT4, chloroplastic [Cicer arietinum]XP_004504289.1 pentatricopeptide repeat-containing protein DOT4, chloroplastic [Cicer arietinum]